jgi:quercetin dioxygenase-like cupin family protein
MEKMMALLEDLPWDAGPYPGSRMKIYPMIEGTPFFCGVIDLEPAAVLEEHDEPFNELSFVIKGDAIIEGKACPEGSYFYTPAGNKHGPFTTREGCQFLIVKFSP